MGLRERFKALNPKLPSGANVLDTNQMILQQQQRSGQTNFGQQVNLPRDFVQVPFGEGNPILPSSINPLSANGRPAPRRDEYQVAINMNVSANRAVDFKALRSAADGIDILRRCIEVLKSKVTGLEWDIVLGEDATEQIATSTTNQTQAMLDARAQFSSEINRARMFWEQPDPSNGLIFTDWLGMALEEILVLDAWAVWPQTTVGGDLIGLQILDGSTIKPLIDDRGMRPLAPNPAYQQILYGAPRSEFMASSADDNAEFSADQLSYMVRNRRSNTLYGNPPVERALPVADLYLRRQMWLRAEYTDGVTPELMMETDATFGSNANVLRAFEDSFNADLAGQLEQRKRIRLLPVGMKPIQFEGYGERFKETFDEYLVTTISGHFGVQPTEIGFMQKGSMGGAGVQQGQAESAEKIGTTPLANWIARMITNLSYTYLGMPKELEFKFLEQNREDKLQVAQTQQIELQSGGSINELRSSKGLSLIDSPEADMPIFVVGMNAYFITPNGAVAFADSTKMGIDGEIEEPETPAQKDTEIAINPDKPSPDSIKEVKAFLRWVKKSPDRQFNFEHTPPVFGDTLNRFLKVGDHDAARWYAENYLDLI